MDFYNTSLEFSTRGNADIVEITDEVGELLLSSGFTSGLVNIFVPGATGGITTLEHEPGVCQDFRELFDDLAPPDKDYHHNRRQVDSNGHSHVRAALLGPLSPCLSGTEGYCSARGSRSSFWISMRSRASVASWLPSWGNETA